MTWTTFSFSVGQVLTAAQMNNLYSNFASMAANETNAPDITSITNVTIDTATVTTCNATNIQANGAVGSFAFMRTTTPYVNVIAGSTYSGSSLRRAGVWLHEVSGAVFWDLASGATASGTWRALGTVGNDVDYYSATLFVRIS